MSFRWSIARVLFAITLVLMLSGCLFLRLSRALVQMKEPYRYLEVDLEASSFHGKLKEPIVYLKDIETIVGFKAEEKERYWLFLFEKLGPSDREPWSFKVWTSKKGMVEAFELPPRVSAILGNAWVMSGLKAIGKAEVSIREKRVFLNVGESLTKQQVLELLGEPSKKESKRWIYRFGSKDQPVVLDLDMEEEGASHMLMSSGKLSASFKFLPSKETKDE